MKKISDFLRLLDQMNYSFEFQGKKNERIDSFCSINSLQNNAITWIKKPEKYNSDLLNAFTGLCVVTTYEGKKQFESVQHNFIYCQNPKEIYFTLLTEFFYTEEYAKEIHPTAVVETKNYGKDLYVGIHTYIGKDVHIGNNVVIKNNCSIEGKVQIDDNTIIHSGVVIGTDGYGYYKSKDGLNKKVPHFGGVKIGKNVEIGANTCIDRGTLNDTIIGDHVKIDNLCHIGHNVIIEKNCMVIAQTMLGGSVHLKKNAYIAPCAAIINQATIGENTLVGLGAVVTKDVIEHVVVAGVPARVIRNTQGE